jgi:asparagine synthase (glutamine-hydrolysing)
MMLLDQRTWLADNVLVKADRAGMLASLEIRTPYLHRSIAEFAASIPAKVHMRGRGKGLLRSLLAQREPAARHRRSKVAFRAPVAAWLRGPLGPMMQEQLATGALVEGDWFSRPALGQIADEHLAGRCDHSRILWPVLTLGLWLDSHRSDGRTC